MAYVDIADHTTNSFNPGDIASRAFGGNLSFGISGSQIQTIAIVAAVAVVAWLLLMRKR